jgi:transposase
MATSSGKYSPELRAEVVRVVLEEGRTYAQAARDFGLIPETVRHWVKAERKKSSATTGSARDAVDRAQVSEMERRIRELEAENAFLKKVIMSTSVVTVAA